MNLLIKSVKIIDPASEFHGKETDILIREGKYTAIGNADVGEEVQIVDGKNKCLTPGWMDIRANFRDPGHEYKEDIHSGLKAAAAGGFTAVVLMPSTDPSIDSKADIEYISGKAAGNPVEVIPVGSLSKNRKGLELAEMYDMFLAGAKGFTDDKHSVKEAGLLVRAMDYVKNFGGIIMNFPYDDSLSPSGQINEGITSTLTGLKAIPSIAEELMVARDLTIAEYTGGKIHIGPVSSAGSVQLIREAKTRGIHVTAEVCAHQLFFNEEALLDFEPTFKVLPPFRSEKDRMALLEGLRDGTLDVISSDHSPEDTENKVLEFDHAAFGISNIETAFSVAYTAAGEYLGMELLLSKFIKSPRMILDINIPVIKTGENANFTLFDPEKEWTPAERDLHRKSKFTPFLGRKLKGKVEGIYNKGVWVAN